MLIYTCKGFQNTDPWDMTRQIGESSPESKKLHGQEHLCFSSLCTPLNCQQCFLISLLILGKNSKNEYKNNFFIRNSLQSKFVIKNVALFL